MAGISHFFFPAHWSMIGASAPPLALQRRHRRTVSPLISPLDLYVASQVRTHFPHPFGT